MAVAIQSRPTYMDIERQVFQYSRNNKAWIKKGSHTGNCYVINSFSTSFKKRSYKLKGDFKRRAIFRPLGVPTPSPLNTYRARYLCGTS